MKCRAVWISDVHLGSKHAQVGKLLAFLRDLECERLYIVGDFIDGWQLNPNSEIGRREMAQDVEGKSLPEKFGVINSLR
jgi:UDP-2,3-diacylglucosamine pyrophosphatase LpxH